MLTYFAHRKKREKYEEFLKSVKIFATIELYELTKVMDAVKPLEFTEGAQIIQEVIQPMHSYRAMKATYSSSLSQERHMQQKCWSQESHRNK